MKKLYLVIQVLLIGLVTLAQTPIGFSYQAVLRDGDGKVIANQDVNFFIRLTTSSGSPIYYSELHSINTNDFGLINIIVGQGTNQQGSLANVPWGSEQIILSIAYRLGANGQTIQMDPQPLQAVPYALHAANTKTIDSDPNANDEEPIFVVRNKEGQIVFAVYQSGVRIYVDDNDTGKRPKGGFAVGGFSTGQGKNGEQNFFMVTSDSTRVSFKESTDGGKSPKGGFAVGGFSSGQGSQDYLNVTPDHTQVSFADDGTKRPKGGFAVGGFSTGQGKGMRDYFLLSPDSARIYFDDSDTKRPKGGFAVGGFSHSKVQATDIIYLNPKNYFIGEGAGRSIIHGEYNIFIGHEAGANTTGTHGDMDPTDGDNNIFMGYRAGYSNVYGEQNIYIGAFAAEKNSNGSHNTYLGATAGQNNSGYGNTLIGYAAGVGPWGQTTTGYKNTFVGSMVGTSTTSGNGNVFIGRESGSNNTTGSENVYIGHLAGANNSTASGNVFIGSKAGWYSNQSNTLIIHNAADPVASIPTNSLIYGSFSAKTLRFNAGVGINAAPNALNGLIADLASVDGSYGIRSYANYIGVYTSASGTGSSGNRFGIYSYAAGGTNNYAGYFSGNVHVTGTFTNPSDQRLKKEIKPIEPVLDKILKLQGVSYLWKSENELPDFVNASPEAKDLGNRFNFPEGIQLGVIAQEVEKLFPQLVLTDAEGVKSVDYIKFTPIFIEAFKEQQKEIDELRAKNAQLEGKLQELEMIKAEIEYIKNLLK